MADRSVTLFGWRVSWERVDMTRVSIQITMSAELACKHTKTAIIVAQRDVERLLTEFVGRERERR